MDNNRKRFLLAALVIAMPSLSQAAPPDGAPDGNPPPRPTCTYTSHACLVSSPELSFAVSKINGITPSSSNDCKLLPPCGHLPPPPRAGDNPPPHPGEGDAAAPPADDNAPPKP